MKIVDFLKNSFVQKILMLFIIFILAFFVFKNCGRTTNDDEILRLNQNIEYYKDSLMLVKNKVGEIEYQRSVLASSNNDLKNKNSSLSKEVDKEKGKVIFLQKLVASLEDSLEIDDPDNFTVKIWPNGDQSISVKLDTTYSEGNFKKIEAETKFSFLKDTNIIDNNSIKFNLKESISLKIITGLQEDKKTGLLKIFVRSEYPNINFSQIDGVIIDPNKSDLIKSYFPPKKIGIGFNIGYGIGVDRSGIVRALPYFGVGVSYNLIRF